MGKFQISGRDVKIFVFGMLFMLLLMIIYDWKEFKSGFTAGYKEARKEAVK